MASEGMQLAVTLLVFIFIGLVVDKRFNSAPWGMLAGSALGIVLGLYVFLRKYISQS